MAIDITKGNHNVAFMSKVFAVENGHIFNLTIAKDRDNGQLAVRDVTSWNSFDNYDEDDAGTITFSGLVRGQGANGGYYVEVLSVSQDVLFVYNSPVSEYAERELQDESLFYNKAGETVQGIPLERGDIIELSAIAFTGTISDDASVSYDKSTEKYIVSGTSS